MSNVTPGSASSAPASPGELWAVPTVDTDAEKRALFAAEDAKKEAFAREADVAKAAFSDDAKAAEDARFAARQADERAMTANRQASETSFTTRQKLDEKQTIEKRNDGIMAVDTNRNGKPDYVEAQEAKRAQEMQMAASLVTAAVVASGATQAFGDASAPRGGYSAFDSNAASPASPAVAAPTTAAATPAAARPQDDAPVAMGAAPSSNPVLTPDRPIVFNAGTPAVAVAGPVAARDDTPAFSPMSEVSEAFAATQAPRGSYSSYDSNVLNPANPIVAGTSLSDTGMIAAPIVAAPVRAAPNTGFTMTLPPPAPVFKKPAKWGDT